MITALETKPNIKSGDNPKRLNGGLIDLACIAALIVLLALTFGRTLESFFIADDFGEVRYVHKIFNGQPGLFWLNFVDNYMQIPSMAVWRPWLLATLVFDYAIWKGNAFGYYLTNLLYYTGNAVLIYALLRKLTSTWSTWRSQAMAFFTAALFTVSPLHCESVTWVVGRVDVVCCFYYLLSFLLFLNTGRFQKLSTIIGTVSFWLALWTKEMAIGLPVMVTATYLLLLPSGNGLIEKLRHAIFRSIPLWISTIVYFPLRYAFLGTLTGGYTGSIGASQFAGLIKRWMDPDTVHRIVYPLNYSLFQNSSIYTTIFSAAYLIVGAIFVSRLLNRQLSFGWTALLLLWLATCAAPIYQLWGLGYDLEGSRFYYFLTLPLSLTLPLCLLQPGKEANNARKWPLFLSVATLAALTFAYSKVAYATNMTWVHAGKEAKAVLEESKKLATGSTDQFIVLGLPKRNSAAHIILNGDTYHLMLRPPFTPSSIDQRFNTFEPILFGPGEFISPSRFKALLKTKAVPLVWSGKNKRFHKLTFDKARASVKPIELLSTTLDSKWLPYHLGQGHFSNKTGNIIIENPSSGDGLSFSELAINPLDYDYLSFEFQTKDSLPLTFQANWHSRSAKVGEASITLAGSDKYQYRTVYIPLSHYWRWFAQPTITELHLLMPQTAEIKIRNVQLLPASIVAPQLKLATASDTIGIYTLVPGAKFPFEVVKSKPDDSVEIQISKPNFFFENFDAQHESTAIDKTLTLRKSQSKFSLDDTCFAKPGYYQVRAARKEPSIHSDVVTIQRLP